MLHSVSAVMIFCAETIHLNSDARYQGRLDAILNNKPPPDSKSDQAMSDWLWKLSVAYTDMRKYDEAEVVDKAIVAISPGYFASHSNLSVDYGKQGKFDAAIEEAKIAILLCPGDAMHPYLLLCTWLYLSGQKEAAFQIFAKIEIPTDVKRRSLYYGCKASFYSSVGDAAIVKESITEAIKTNTPHLSFFERDISFDRYRNEDWFIELVGKTLADR
jgi:tetratricopeptide (TPR) repeat protein